MKGIVPLQSQSYDSYFPVLTPPHLSWTTMGLLGCPASALTRYLRNSNHFHLFNLSWVFITTQQADVHKNIPTTSASKNIPTTSASIARLRRRGAPSPDLVEPLAIPPFASSSTSVAFYCKFSHFLSCESMTKGKVTFSGVEYLDLVVSAARGLPGQVLNHRCWFNILILIFYLFLHFTAWWRSSLLRGHLPEVVL